MKLISMTIERACEIKDYCGRQRYRPAPHERFVGEPLVELFEELVDALNYAQEASRQGHDLGAIGEELRGIAERVKAIWREAEGPVQR